MTRPAFVPVMLTAATLLLADTASAQQPAPQTLQLAPKAAPGGVKYHASFMLSGGFDLDAFGTVLEATLGSQGSAQVAVRQSVAWPDIYVTVPKRAEFSVGFGIFQKDEIVARISRATYTSDPLADAGNFASPSAFGDLTVDVSQYREQSWEIGLRHYLVNTPRIKQYANIMYGVRTVQPISANLTGSDGVGSIGTFRLYEQAKLKSYSLEMGLTFEFGHVGVFAQVGGRFVERLKRTDEDLATWSLEALNNSGSRFYMPAQFGVLFRL